MSLRQAILDNVNLEVRGEVAWALDLVQAESFYDLALTFRDYASDMASGALRGSNGQTYEGLGTEDLARIDAALRACGAQAEQGQRLTNGTQDGATPLNPSDAEGSQS